MPNRTFKCCWLLALAAIFFANCAQNTLHEPKEKTHRPSHAGDALRMWAMARVFPDGQFRTENYATALAEARLQAQLRGGSGNVWESLGPKNIGGRTLCLAIHPQDTNIMFAGTASGGLWKTTTAGRGYSAWQYIETGFPVLGVSGIAINPLNPNEMYIGTGEVYNLENSMPNVAIRVTRGTYGIGILKTLDGGLTWQKSLDWSYGQLRGVQDVKINHLRPATVYAATSEGFYRSWDSGATWHQVTTRKMAVDIEQHPTDTSILFVTYGSLDDQPQSGIFRSTDGGSTFTKLSGGLPAAYSGKALLSICTSQPNVIYASVGNNFSQEGMYKSQNGGDTWTRVSTKNVASYQGWYSHDVSVNPLNPDEAIWVGVDLHKTDDGGTSWPQKTNWFAWDFGQVPVGGPEGPPNYVHADIHRVYHVPSDPYKVYCATDGGVFVSYDAGETWEGRNGSFQCTQFYANLGNSTTNPLLAIGGMQDNSTAIYTGDDAWTRVLGGDGECAAIDPSNDQYMYGSSQYLAIYRSEDGGQNFYYSAPNAADPCFNGPFEIAPSEPERLYAGGTDLWRSFDRAVSWDSPYNGPVDNGNAILTIAICPTDPNLLYFSTAPTSNNTISVFKSINGGLSFTKLTGLPNRMCMDIAFHPTDKNTAYAVFAGFAADQVWRTTDGGQTWQAVSTGLPAIPTNTVLVDPQCPKHVYIGNDLGVWLSKDGGNSWENYSLDAPKGLLVMHLSISPANQKLRVATYGLGVWQTDLATCVPSGATEPALAEAVSLKIFPNPAAVDATLSFDLPAPASTLNLRFFDVTGREIRRGQRYRLGNLPAGEHQVSIDVRDWADGVYGAVLEGRLASQNFKKAIVFQKN